MSGLASVVHTFRRRARAKRARVFREVFEIMARTRIVDIGSEDGSSIAAVLQGTGVKPKNVYIADIESELVQRGHKHYGFVPVVIPESGRLPFEDQYFDIVYCSSVIEHVTVPKAIVWNVVSGKEFREAAAHRQAEFAAEIRRLGKGYFVQTPNKWFPIESHTWLPLVSYLPRWILVPLLNISNRFWVKKTTPDWFLLTATNMKILFPDAVLRKERFAGLTKSIMAIKGN